MLGTLVQCDRCESAAGGGHPGGQIRQVYGIVEFKDGVWRIDPAKIKFCDDENAILAEMEKHNRAGKLEGQ